MMLQCQQSVLMIRCGERRAADFKHKVHPLMQYKLHKTNNTRRWERKATTNGGTGNICALESKIAGVVRVSTREGWRREVIWALLM